MVIWVVWVMRGAFDGEGELARASVVSGGVIVVRAAPFGASHFLYYTA